ncbi:peroxisomal membrane protein 2 pxmp2 mpv17 [Holotrichia oblita]|uniref:Peroxisomal membrane protein 2 pxmp2 mpv17 n=2 Tax=Holotrichia oblita TaxID=644536 RepID=A0ACB9TG52_HOLOL|nr:peroxisomal membrane protein 2 pxmp2 mpv17 [Holotrichia oblita]KAI4465863.1 peroxisomal membrane protein 2 pxmp2 mpv17 [Holotrichia oblita]
MSLGDISAQTIIEKKDLRHCDLVRTARFGSLGIILIGPVCAQWFRFLASKIGTKGSTVALKKVALDQLCFAPCMMFVFLTTLNTLQRNPWEETKRHIKANYVDIMIANYKVWPAIQLMNFYIIPTYYQLLLVQAVALFWNTYLAWKTARKLD